MIACAFAHRVTAVVPSTATFVVVPLLRSSVAGRERIISGLQAFLPRIHVHGGEFADRRTLDK